ncbi:PFL family protein [Limosilactobacillus reuteri]|uniref:PFL family protein n=1 Tax=Limosilactobacillus reuteri TaxID=1598 RepID=UPI001E65BA90|nr:PFL family protein [Limosilactobacillus reuteri]MCC4346622.1 PFL family protein [Limosilactobacillus reuteri]MCC4387970.1 PFL family protein [Limosilactobacillus reuteri]MCC4389255.1 PFL family protein [Limosilactobacillus reuteri]MCC4391272.1 PFL family protein [Limosilactobacillus reuteri]MCC4393113.1 PFL family protein [Limosilactobacillus reuteri]
MNSQQIYETSHMISNENLDVRTITMGISLLDCIDSDSTVACQKIYDKITTKAKDLVKVGKQIEAEYGIPIANKRVTVTPISLIVAASQDHDYVKYAKTLDRAAKTLGIDFIGGYSALVQKGYQTGDRTLIASLPEALAETNFVCASVNVGSTRSGINMDAVAQMGEVVVAGSKLDMMTNAKLVIFCNAVEDNPFMAGGFHGVGEPDVVINVGVSGPGVIKTALEKVKGESMDVVAETIKKTAFKVTRMGQLVGTVAAERLGVQFGIVDLSLAPTAAAGDSVAEVLEEIGVAQVGTHGTTAALAMLNDAVKKGGIMACSHVGGLSGAFIPVSEDAGMIKAVNAGTLNISKLEAMTAVCSVGLDMIAIPGDTPKETISAMIADEAAIGMINNKTTAVRVIPAPGKKVGDTVEFGGLLGYAPVMAVNKAASTAMINRGGLIPAPIHSFKN